MSVRIVSATPAFRRSPDHLHTPALAPVATTSVDLEVQRCRRLAEMRHVPIYDADQLSYGVPTKAPHQDAA
jgi:hypothetical protein